MTIITDKKKLFLYFISLILENITTMKQTVCLLVATLALFSCQEQEAIEPEMYHFPITLYPTEVSSVSELRLFASGQEVSDTALCNRFAEYKWYYDLIDPEYFPNYKPYKWFDRSSFLDLKYLPDSIVFYSRDSADNRLVRSAGNQFLFYSEPFDPTTVTSNEASKRCSAFLKYTKARLPFDESNQVRGVFVAYGTYNELELSVINMQNRFADAIVNKDWGSRIIGVAGRYINEFNPDYAPTMPEGDTVLYQEYKVRYRNLPAPQIVRTAPLHQNTVQCRNFPYIQPELIDQSWMRLKSN